MAISFRLCKPACSNKAFLFTCNLVITLLFTLNLNAQNSVSNGDFVSSGLNWAPVPSAPTIEAYNSEVVYGGIDANNIVAEIDDWASLRQTNIPVIPGQQYTLRFRHSRRIDPSVSNPNIIKVKVYDAATTFLDQNVVSANASWNWQCKSFQFTPTSSTISLDFTNVSGNNVSLGTIVDDITIIRSNFTPSGISVTGSRCAGSSIILTAPQSTAGITYSNYIWTTPAGIIIAAPSVTLNNIQAAQNGVYTCTMNLNSCQTITSSYTLSVMPVYNLNKYDTVCAGASYTWAGQTYNTGGNYFHNFATTAGCDSNVILHLFVRPVITNTVAHAICAGSTYSWGGQSYNTSGTYTHIFPSATNCDSTVTLNLTVQPAITYTFADTVCAGSSYTWVGQAYNTSGTYTHTFTTLGCDSNVTLHLFVRPAITNTVAHAICVGSTYSWGGQSYNTGGTYIHLFPSATNCDSTVALNLTVQPAITYTFADTVCAGFSYIWAGQAYNTSGTYTHTFTTSGCDSNVTLHLFVRPAITNTVAHAICAGSTYSWGGQSYNTGGTYIHVFPSATNCDSTVALNLTVHPAIINTVSHAICAGSTYSWGGQAYNTDGTYTHIFQSATNCDSTVTLNLTVQPAITYTFADTVCAGSSYTWAGQTYNTSGTYTHTFMTAGCDSNVTLHLFVRPAITNTVAHAICAGSTYSWGGQSYNTSGTYTHIFPSATNCDSTVTLNLTVYPVITNTVAHAICAGSTYSWGGQSYNTSGTYTHVFPSATNCDSMVTLNLTVQPAITYTFADTVCAGSSYIWAGQTYNTSGTYTHTFMTFGCDSNVTLHLFVRPTITNIITDTICAGTRYNWGGQALIVSGIYTDTLASYTGCDSVVTLNLTVNPQVVSNITAAICSGQSYVLGTQLLSASGSYTEPFVAATGCDSIVHLNLSVSLPPVNVNIDTAACGSLAFESTIYTSSIVLNDTFHTVSGCDSAYRQVNITIYNNIPSVVFIDTVTCDSLLFEGHIYTEGVSFSDTFRTAFGCDSLVRMIHIGISRSGVYEMDREICQGETFSYNGQDYATSGKYSFSYKNMGGCDSIINLNLVVNPLPDVAVEDLDNLSHCVGDSVRLELSGASIYELQEGYGYADNNIGRILLNHNKNFIKIEGTDSKGCRNTDSIEIGAQDCCGMWMPNAFSPNGDGLNDKLNPETKGHPSQFIMRIFNRWGENVFTSYKITDGWDGTIHGRDAEIGTYHYAISGTCTDGKSINVKGSAILLR